MIYRCRIVRILGADITYEWEDVRALGPQQAAERYIEDRENGTACHDIGGGKDDAVVEVDHGNGVMQFEVSGEVVLAYHAKVML